MTYADAARAALGAFRGVSDAEGVIWPAQAVVALAKLDQTRSALAYALNDDRIWDAPLHGAWRRRASAAPRGDSLIDSGATTTGATESQLIRAAEERARSAGADRVREWHLAEAVVDLFGTALLATGLDADHLVLATREREEQLTQ